LNNRIILWEKKVPVLQKAAALEKALRSHTTSLELFHKGFSGLVKTKKLKPEPYSGQKMVAEGLREQG